MKNTEYKDVFDIGEEALSMENKFSFNKNIQIQNTLGETIRGMSRVSPILQTKPVAVDSQFIQKYYFIDATKKNKDKEILIEEVKFMKRDGYSFAIEEFFEDANKNGILGDAGDLLDFKLLIFSTNDGNKIREAHNVVQPKADEIILFLESDSDLLTGKARLFAKIGSGIRKKFFDKNNKLINNSLTEKIQTKKNDIETKTLIELLEKGSVKENIISIEGFMNLFKDQLLAMLVLNYILGEIVDSVGDKIDFLKIPDSFWDSDNPDYFFDKDNLIENIKISDEKIIQLENIFVGTGLIFAGPFAPMVPLTMKVLAPKLKPIAKQWIDSFNQHITNVIQDVFAKIETDPLSNLLWKEAQKQIAFECGIWNGIVDFISSFFKFIALVLKSPVSIIEDPALTLETLDNIFDFLESGEVFSTLRIEFSTFCKNLVADLQEQGSDDINWTKVFYIIGFGVVFVASFFIPYANVIKVLGSLGKLGEIFTIFIKTFEEFLKIAKVSTGNTFGKLSSSLTKIGQKAISEFLALFKSGSRLRRFLTELRAKIIEWIKKSKKQLTRLQELLGLGLSKETIAKLESHGLKLGPGEHPIAVNGIGNGNTIAIYHKGVKIYEGFPAGIAGLSRKLEKMTAEAAEKYLDNLLQKYLDDYINAQNFKFRQSGYTFTHSFTIAKDETKDFAFYLVDSAGNKELQGFSNISKDGVLFNTFDVKVQRQDVSTAMYKLLDKVGFEKVEGSYGAGSLGQNFEIFMNVYKKQGNALEAAYATPAGKGLNKATNNKFKPVDIVITEKKVTMFWIKK
jgi:hypothetical protein